MVKPISNIPEFIFGQSLETDDSWLVVKTTKPRAIMRFDDDGSDQMKGVGLEFDGPPEEAANCARECAEALQEYLKRLEDEDKWFDDDDDDE